MSAEVEGPGPHGARSRPRSPAFTLLEILVTLGVIAVLAGLALPAYQRAVERGRAAACVSHLRQLGAALSLYLGENNNVMPTLEEGREKITDEKPVIDNTLDRYVKDKSVFACPSDKVWAQRTGASYGWNVALNGQSLGSLNFFGVVQDLSRIPVLADKEGFHAYSQSKVNVLYADGHASNEVSFFAGQ
ncbi:MAG: prepilin-type N-terminal cleavage/methylation domain-containing protein [Verrucomicrobiota bacterium]|nr:prepilin-type N-terminal cleavage/methylation domain-containing protein [Verrucomicrobiota bacterium]